MPRDRRAVIGTAIWNEPSIRALTPAQQHAYFLVYTQPDVNRCGVLAYNLRRWSQLAAGLTPRTLRKVYKELHNSRHLVVDEEYEELFVRAYAGHDGLLAQPLVVAAMVRDWQEVTSPTIRVAILRELRRLWDLDEQRIGKAERVGLLLLLGADPQSLGIAASNDVQLGRIRGALGDALVDPMVAAIAAGEVDPYPDGLPEGHPKGLPDGLPEGLTVPRARASRVSPFPTPYTTERSSSTEPSPSSTSACGQARLHVVNATIDAGVDE